MGPHYPSRETTTNTAHGPCGLEEVRHVSPENAGVVQQHGV